MTIFFTSDTHFWHARVIEFCARPWPDVQSMNEGLIKNWNETVGPDDTVFVLGDFVFGGVGKITDIMGRLNGTKRLVIGNHDGRCKPDKWVKLGFETAQHSDLVVVDDRALLCSHFPWREYQHDERTFKQQLEYNPTAWLLHGHVHCEWKRKGNMINVGVDQWNYRPVSLDEIVELVDAVPPDDYERHLQLYAHYARLQKQNPNS